jgi:hypothetical protein
MVAVQSSETLVQATWHNTPDCTTVHSHCSEKPKSHRPWVCENRTLRKIFWHTSENVTRGWRKLHSRELHNLYSLLYIRIIKSRLMRWVGNVVCMGAVRNTYSFCKEGWRKRPLQTSRHRWEHSIERNFNKIEWNGMEWINLPQDMDKWWSLMNISINFWVP